MQTRAALSPTEIAALTLSHYTMYKDDPFLWKLDSMLVSFGRQARTHETNGMKESKMISYFV